jgi:serine protease Do
MLGLALIPYPPVVPSEPPAIPQGPVSNFTELSGTIQPNGAEPNSYSGYTWITDDTGLIRVSVPNSWTDIDGRPLLNNQGVDVRASSDLKLFQETWDTPGVIVSVFGGSGQFLDVAPLLDERVEPLSSDCTYAGRGPYSDALYTGQFDLYTECGGIGAAYVVVGAVPVDSQFTIRVEVQVNSARDLDALDKVLDSFHVTSNI